ncbi:mannonate dehydratase [Ruegeria hyattellae]|uniref:mannonate dehydratase n=1 Tax=Ruegeria hyattellae TaxID=3233337 RepID=UPI00355AFD23
MRQTWRWFGLRDRVSLSSAHQAGASGVVTALHHIPPGIAWTAKDIRIRQEEVRTMSQGALEWEVAESLPVSEAIKTKSKEYHAHIEAYKASLMALAEAGISTICYNFMPVLDWTRTDLRWPLPNGGTAMRFDLIEFAAFDCFILNRDGAADSYDDATLEAAKRRFSAMSDAGKTALTEAIVAGLPGATESWTLTELGDAIACYADIDRDQLRRNHIEFLSEVVTTAESLRLRMCCHPDDPPFPLLGLPRVMSSAEDYGFVLDAVDSPSVGMTLCTGSLGASPGNDCVAIARKFAPKIHFLHLRNVTRDSEQKPCSFFEDEHLAGQVDMVGVIDVILAEEARRRRKNRKDAQIPMRPDHGQEILSDLNADLHPGYPAVGRLKGLAEIRGVIAGLSREAVQ